MNFRKALVTPLTLLAVGCAPRGYRTATVTQAVITRTVVLPQVPSGSALVQRRGLLYIVSDDAPYIYTYNLTSGSVDSLWIQSTNSRLHRIAWQTKPDYEAALVADWQGSRCLFAFGSGSLPAYREWIGVYRLDEKAPQERYDARPLYAHLRKTGALPEQDFNLEGAALTPDGDLVLLNRGRQQLFRMRWTDFTTWLTTQTLPDITVQNLPIPEGATYTFSGAESLDSKHLLFTASQEATNSSQQDGAILGSALGILENEKTARWTVKKLWPVVDASEKEATEKIESAIPQPGDKSGRKFIALTDNDDGQSKLLWIELR